MFGGISVFIYVFMYVCMYVCIYVCLICVAGRDEIQQISLIFNLIGAPTSRIWPEIGRVQFSSMHITLYTTVVTFFSLNVVVSYYQYKFDHFDSCIISCFDT